MTTLQVVGLINFLIVGYVFFGMPFRRKENPLKFWYSKVFKMPFDECIINFMVFVILITSEIVSIGAIFNYRLAKVAEWNSIFILLTAFIYFLAGPPVTDKEYQERYTWKNVFALYKVIIFFFCIILD